MVAVTKGIYFDFDQLQPPGPSGHRIADVLDQSIGPDDPRWRPFDYLKENEVRDAAKCNSFGMQVVSPEDDKVPTLRKGYHKGGSTDPLLQHPTEPTLLRQFTAAEHARIKEVPEHLVDGLSNTVAHEVLGQGIVYPPFRDVGRHVGAALNRFVGNETSFKRDEAQEDPDQGITLEELAGEMGLKLHKANPISGKYVGEIVASDETMFIQDVGKHTGVVHLANQLDVKPRLGASARVSYEKGQGQVIEKGQKQLDLGLNL
jgi:DNA (cytosine-5)-methyltransferase 1